MPEAPTSKQQRELRRLAEKDGNELHPASHEGAGQPRDRPPPRAQALDALRARRGPQGRGHRPSWRRERHR